MTPADTTRLRAIGAGLAAADDGAVVTTAATELDAARVALAAVRHEARARETLRAALATQALLAPYDPGHEAARVAVRDAGEVAAAAHRTALAALAAAGWAP